MTSGKTFEQQKGLLCKDAAECRIKGWQKIIVAGRDKHEKRQKRLRRKHNLKN